MPKKELRYTLKTGDLSAAKAKARLMAGRVQLLYRDIREEFLVKMNLSDVQLQSMLQKFMEQLRQEYDQPARYDQYVDEEDYHQYETYEDAVKGALTGRRQSIMPRFTLVITLRLNLTLILYVLDSDSGNRYRGKTGRNIIVTAQGF